MRKLVLVFCIAAILVLLAMGPFRAVFSPVPAGLPLPPFTLPLIPPEEGNPAVLLAPLPLPPLAEDQHPLPLPPQPDPVVDEPLPQAAAPQPQTAPQPQVIPPEVGPMVEQELEAGLRSLPMSPLPLPKKKPKPAGAAKPPPSIVTRPKPIIRPRPAAAVDEGPGLTYNCVQIRWANVTFSRKRVDRLPEKQRREVLECLAGKP